MVTVAEAEVRFKGSPGSLLQDARTQGARAGEAGGTAFGESFNEAGKRLVAGFIGAELILKSTEFLKDSVKVAADAAATTDRLAAALTASGAASSDDAARIHEQTVATAALGFTGTETEASLVGLVTATHDLGKATADQNIAMDLARLKHISLQEASDALVKVEGGRFKLLAGLGIILEKGATQEQALAAVRAAASGQSIAFANTEEGAQAKLNVAFESLQVTLGTKLLPAITDLANFTREDVVPALGFVVDHLNLIIEIAATLGTVKLVGLAAGMLATATASTAAAVGADAEAISLSAVGLASDATAPQLVTVAGAEDAVAVSAAGASTALGASGLLGRLAGLAGPISLVVAAFGGVVLGADALSAAIHKNDTDFEAQRTTLRLLQADQRISTGEFNRQMDAIDANEAAMRQAYFTSTQWGHQLETNTDTMRGATTAVLANASGLDEVARAQLALTVAIGNATGATDDEKKAAQNATVIFKQLGTVFDGFNTIVPEASAHMGTFSADLDNAAMKAAALNVHTAALLTPTQQLADQLKSMYGVAITDGDAALYLARGMNAAAIAAQLAAAGVAAFKAGHPTNLRLPGGTADTQVQFNPGTINTGAGSVGDQGALDASLRAFQDWYNATHQKVAAVKTGLTDLARVTKIDLTSSFQTAKSSADALFDAMHQKALTAIQDQKNIAYATAERTANDARAKLAADQAALFVNPDAEQTAFNAHLAAEQRAGLVAQTAAAAKALRDNVDPSQIASLRAQVVAARQALKDYDDQAKINADHAAAQAAANALATANQTIDPVTHAPTTVIDLTLAGAKARADAAAQHATDIENAKAARDKKAFDTTFDRLAKELEATKSIGKRKQILEEIQNLYDKSGLTAADKAKASGRLIALALADGLKAEVKAVEAGAESLVTAINKFIRTHSPTEKGPWSTEPPASMGRSAARQFAEGMNAEAATYGGPFGAYAFDGASAAGGSGASSGPGAAGAVAADMSLEGHFTIDLGPAFGNDRIIEIVERGLVKKLRS